MVTTYREIPEHLKNRTTFHGASMHGLAEVDVRDHLHPRYGLLADEEKVRLLLDEGVGLTYVVYSYGTPVAWVRTDGQVYVVAQKFNATTSRHQRLCRRFLADQ